MKKIIMLIGISGIISSCAVKMNLDISSLKIYQGDSVKVTWNVQESRLIKLVAINNLFDKLPISGEKYIRPKKDTTVELIVYAKNKEKPYRIKKRIRVIKPEILVFSAFRDRFFKDQVVINWNVKGATNISIEGYKYNLPASGHDTMTILKAATLTLVAKTPFKTLRKSCFVEEASDLTMRPMIFKDTAILQLSARHKINLRIIETELSGYPEKIKLKVIAYDSLGNFITHLAPPFGSDETVKKYFHRIVDKVNNEAREVEFEVKEIHDDQNKFDVALSLDYSGSMTPYMSFYEKATKKFIANKYPDDNFSVTKFDHRLALYCSLNNDYSDILKRSFPTGDDTLFGGTALYAGIDKALESLNNATNKKILIPFTDGFENSSMIYMGRYASNISELVQHIRMKNAKLMMIGLGMVNVTLLQELAYYTNGDFYYLASPSAITQVYKDLQHNMRTYYEITIKPLKREGEHQFQITYYNNIDTTTTTRPCYVGNAVDFVKFEVDTNAYWYDKKLAGNKYKLVTSPQTLINFEKDEDQVRPEFQRSTMNFVGYLKKNPNTVIRIFGHTDTKGKEQHNDNLSMRRAEAIKSFLVSNGIHPKRIEVFGLASLYPIHKDDRQEWAAKENRRVEIVLWKKDVKK